MLEFLGLVVAQVVGVLLGALLNAALLIWRALKLRNWVIHYRNAYVVSIKAGFVAVVCADVATIAVALVGGTNDKLLDNVGLLFGLVGWWFMHSSALIKLAGSANPITVKDARALSASVFSFGILFFLAIGVGVLLIFLALKALK